MNRILPAAVCSLALFGYGCATKKYVRNTVDPVRDQVQSVSKQTNQNGSDIAGARKDMERDEAELSATKERAASADTHAGEAMNKANEAGTAASAAQQAANQANTAVGELRNTVANLDDYKVIAEQSIPFSFNKYKLNKQDQSQLDELAANAAQMKRYFIAVEGFTDRSGSNDYNLELSRKRADAVVQYLVANHGVPLYRVHEIGLGKQMMADEGHGRQANAKNRRVTVTVYSADPGVTAMNRANNSGQNNGQPQPQPQR